MSLFQDFDQSNSLMFARMRDKQGFLNPCFDPDSSEAKRPEIQEVFLEVFTLA